MTSQPSLSGPTPVRFPSLIRDLAPRPRTLLLGCLFLAACGGGGGGGAPPAGTQTLEGSLNRLGVDTTRTSRQAMPGVDVPTGYTPLGAAPALSKTNEMLLFGIGLPTAATSPAITLELTDASGAPTADVLNGQNQTAMPWAAETKAANSAYQSLRAPVAADIDGDGLDETVVVHQNGVELRAYIIDDQTGGFAVRDIQFASLTNVTCVTAAAGDLDGDGDDELVVGLTRNGNGEVRVFRYDGQTFVAAGPVLTFGPTLASSLLHLELATGNIDLDAAEELAIGIEEAQPGTGNARFAVIDDLGNNLATLREGNMTGRDQLNVLQIGLTCSVAIGDIDGDNIGEVLLGSITSLPSGGPPCTPTDYFLLALDDKQHGLADLAGRSFTQVWSNCDSPDQPRIRTLFLHALDLDGDGRAEIQANQFVFQDFAEAAPWTEVGAWRLPQSAIWASSTYGWFARNTASMVTGDFTGDDRDDIAVYRQDSAFVDVYSLGATATAITRVRHIAVPSQISQTPRNPVILPVNVDTDSTVLKYSDADYKFVFTEPIVLAALAAPPTKQGVGQNVDASFTAFGNSSTTITERERSLSFSVGVTAGFGVEGGALTQSEFEVKAKMTVAGTRTVGSAYELTKTIVFTSAPTEDTIVFTSVPVDRFTYTIVSHPDPTMIGKKVVVDLPRAPITLQAERGFYNRTIMANSMHVDASVFQHTIGDPASYPTAAQKGAILAGNSGLQIGPQSVGQGGGSTEVTLEVGNSISHGGALEVGFEIDVEATVGGLIGGVTIGASAESSWKVTSGTSTTYTGVVGAIDAAHFAEHRYLFGLFSYVRRDPTTGQQFQVLNYWVE
jgi:hypothetical protein